MKYTKHKIIRKRDLNESFFELVIQRESLNFSPGSSVKLYNYPELPSMFIASGISEVWVRFILRKSLFTPIYEAVTNSVRLSLEIEDNLPLLIREKSPNFLVTPDLIGIVFSYMSTYPSTKCSVCYLGEDKVQEDWFKTEHNLCSVSELNKCDDVYVLGRGDIIEQKAKKVLSNCKSSYLI